jgi:ABC-type glycerol-3-phosphate transport system substrate-binding protein
MKKISWSFLSSVIILTIIISFTLIGCKATETTVTTAVETTAAVTTAVETTAAETTAVETTAAVEHKSLLTEEPRVQTIEFASVVDVNDPSLPYGTARKEIADNYMKLHPNVTIKFTYIPYADFFPQMVLRVAAGNPPAIMQHGYATSEFVKSGLLVDMSSYLEQSGWSKDDFWPGIWDLTTYNDKQYGVPFTLDTRTLQYNADLFAKAGINPPETWDDLIKNAKTFKDATGANIIGTPSSLVWEFITPLVFSNGGQWIIQDDQGLWKANAESTEVLEAVAKAKELSDSGALIPGWLGDDYTVIMNLFYQGKIASWINGPWQFSTYDTEKKAGTFNFDVGQALVPMMKVHASVSGGWSWYTMKSPSNAWDTDVCWDIINYYLQPENLAKGWFDSIPPTKDYSKVIAANDNRYDIVLKTLENSQFPLKVLPNFWEMLDTIVKYSTQAIQGTKTIDQSMKELDVELQKLLDQGENASIKEAKGL